MRSLQKRLRFGLPSIFLHRRADVAVVFLLVVLTVLTDGDLFRVETILGSDAATQYYPFYHFLGESLRAGEIPAWNPYQFSGAPFAADPLSGWSYLPAMLLFASLPLVAAIKGMMLSHLLLAGLFTYALARTLGIGVPGALLAAIAYEYSGLFYVQNTCCLQYIGVMAWLPLGILGAEIAIRNSSWSKRGLWWGVSGFALSQVLAAWFGQGSYYALLALGGYVTYRTLLSPPYDMRGIRARIAGLALHGGTVLVFGFALAAAGVLPRLEYNALSNLAGGYPADITARGGWSVGDWALLLEPGVWYAGLSVVILALVAPLIAWKRFAVPYFAVLTLCALILTGQGPTPLHSMLYLLPHFEQLHPHSPDRVMVVCCLGIALLAGATLTALGERAGSRKLLVLTSLLLAVLFVATTITFFPPRPEGWVSLYSLSLRNGVSIPVGSLLFLVLTVILAAAYTLTSARQATWRGLTLSLLALVVFADLFVADKATIGEQDLSGEGWLVRIRESDLADYYRPSGAAQYLQSMSEQDSFRYFGYDPGASGEGSQVSDPLWFADPSTRQLEANGRSMLLGLQNVQGYNPTHIASYGGYMNELNGGYEQNYHFIDVFGEGLYSPLLNLLNVNYIIVPSQPSQENPEGAQQFAQFEHSHPTVYEDDQTKVLENQQALPRAWIVHSVQQQTPQEALELLSSGEVDPKETALLEEPPLEEMSEPEDASTDQASVTEYGDNHVQLETSSETAGLLMLSEVYYPAWKAYVDGRPAPVHIADGLLRSVAVPAGDHTVDLRYESWTLMVGVSISLVAYATLVLLAVIGGVRYLRRKRIYD
jgi:hypothetical protein